MNTLKFTTLALILGVSACTPTARIQTIKQQVGYNSRSGITSNNPPYQSIGRKLAAVVVTDSENLSDWQSRKFAIKHAPMDADGGSAAPISADGYFLTASHVISKAWGKNIYVLYDAGNGITVNRARIVWKSFSSDLAILHISQNTPHYYEWSPLERGLPQGQVVYNGGMRWRDTLKPQDNRFSNCNLIYGWNAGNGKAKGKLLTSMNSEAASEGDRNFKMNIPLMPGDSGGPVVDPNGELIGINVASEAFDYIFIDSIGVRPSPDKIEKIINKDR